MFYFVCKTSTQHQHVAIFSAWKMLKLHNVTVLDMTVHSGWSVIIAGSVCCWSSRQSRRMERFVFLYADCYQTVSFCCQYDSKTKYALILPITVVYLLSRMKPVWWCVCVDFCRCLFDVHLHHSQHCYSLVCLQCSSVVYVLIWKGLLKHMYLTYSQSGVTSGTPFWYPKLHAWRPRCRSHRGQCLPVFSTHSSFFSFIVPTINSS